MEDNNIDNGNIKAILDQWDAKKITLDELGRSLLQEIRQGGDVAFLGPDEYQAIFDEADIKEVITNSTQGDLLTTRYFGTMNQPLIPLRDRGVFTSCNRVANWEDPRWLSGNRAWMETAERTYTDGYGMPISYAELMNPVTKTKDPNRLNNTVMTVSWKAVMTPLPVDVLIWKEHDEDGNLSAEHHITYVCGIPMHSHTIEYTY